MLSGIDSSSPSPHTHVRRSIQLACDRESVQLSVLVLGVGALVGHVPLVGRFVLQSWTRCLSCLVSSHQGPAFFLILLFLFFFSSFTTFSIFLYPSLSTSCSFSFISSFVFVLFSSLFFTTVICCRHGSTLKDMAVYSAFSVFRNGVHLICELLSLYLSLL